jgi:hypothetical protein
MQEYCITLPRTMMYHPAKPAKDHHLPRSRGSTIQLAKDVMYHPVKDMWKSNSERVLSIIPVLIPDIGNIIYFLI